MVCSRPCVVGLTRTVTRLGQVSLGLGCVVGVCTGQIRVTPLAVCRAFCVINRRHRPQLCQSVPAAEQVRARGTNDTVAVVPVCLGIGGQASKKPPDLGGRGGWNHPVAVTPSCTQIRSVSSAFFTTCSTYRTWLGSFGPLANPFGQML